MMTICSLRLRLFPLPYLPSATTPSRLRTASNVSAPITFLESVERKQRTSACDS